MHYAHAPLAEAEQGPEHHEGLQYSDRQIDYLMAPASGTPCDRCAGSGWYTLPVPFGHPEFGVLQPCACKESTRREQKAAQLTRLGNLEAFQGKTFANFDTKPAGTGTALRHARNYAKNPSGWLTLVGGYGCGKTHLAAAIANALLEQQIPVLFVIVPDLLDQLRSTFDEDSEVRYDERFDTVKQASFLVLDDLGTESTTSWAREKLYQLVNYRYNLHLPTVFTSNVQIEQLDGRIASRLHDTGIGAQIVVMQAADYRKRKA